MDVRIETQRRGIVHPVPAPGDGHELAARGENQPRGDSHPQTKPASSAPGVNPAASASADGAWFDANGDGVIESWSYSHGGDSFANFTPPPPRSTEPSPHRSNDRSTITTTTTGARTPDHPDAGSGTTAQVHHARTAYRRDGLSNAPVVHQAGGDNAPSGSSGAPPSKSATPKS
jgi:hypothetical protein